MLDHLWRRFEQIVSAELDRQQLDALDDRLLADAGIERASIEAIARGAGRATEGRAVGVTGREARGRSERYGRPPVLSDGRP